MTLGWRTAFVGDIGDPFLRAGTMHMFAIDGLRIALLSGIIVTFLRVLRLSRVWCGFIAVPMIWFYTAATGWDPPAVRADDDDDCAGRLVHPAARRFAEFAGAGVRLSFSSRNRASCLKRGSNFHFSWCWSSP